MCSGGYAMEASPGSTVAGMQILPYRGFAGIYLGPSEESPASVVLRLSDKSVTTSRDIVCYEDRFPGVHTLRPSVYRQSSRRGPRKVPSV